MFAELLARISRALRSHGIPYFVMGGQAVLVHGDPRLTKDIDITLGVDSDRLPEIRELVDQAGLTPLVENDTFVRETLTFPCADQSSGIRVDLVFSFSPFERQALDRVVKRRVNEEDVCFLSVEDLLVQKIVASRPRDLEDARGLVLRNPHLDRKHVESWLREFELTLSEPFLDRWRTLNEGR